MVFGENIQNRSHIQQSSLSAWRYRGSKGSTRSKKGEYLSGRKFDDDARIDVATAVRVADALSEGKLIAKNKSDFGDDTEALVFSWSLIRR